MSYFREIMKKYPLIVILGPTAVGKTTIACHLALQINAEIISADSRQVYRQMNLGTGKDYDDYIIDGVQIPYHLIDIKNPGEEYSVFEFQQDFLKCYQEIREKGKNVILCGGSGLYLDAALAEYKMSEVVINDKLREELSQLSNNELLIKLSQLKKLHNSSDSLDRKRLIRAIEIETHLAHYPKEKMPPINRIIFGLKSERELIKQKIHQRLKVRLEEGMIEEVEQLIAKGISHQKLRYYGLEYKYISLYLSNEMDKASLFTELYKAIAVFAKKQMTWYRRMEKLGTKIHWLDVQNKELKYILFTIQNHIEYSIEDPKK